MYHQLITCYITEICVITPPLLYNMLYNLTQPSRRRVPRPPAPTQARAGSRPWAEPRRPCSARKARCIIDSSLKLSMACHAGPIVSASLSDRPVRPWADHWHPADAPAAVPLSRVTVVTSHGHGPPPAVTVPGPGLPFCST
jgi:hypothetical protein